MIRTFGLGPRAKKVAFWAFGTGPSAEDVGKSQEKCKNNALGKHDRFWTFLWSVDCQIVPKTKSVF